MSTEKSISTLIRRIRRAYPIPEPVQRPPIEEFVFSFLVWEASTQRAEHALKRLLDGALDLNELRVTRADEIAAILGKTFPRADERSERLYLALNDLYRNEHAVSLDRIIAMSKRDGRKCIEDLDGMIPFIAARIALFALDAHAIPIDERTLDLLIEEGVVEEGATVEKTAGKLERHIKSSDAVESHLLLQIWAENDGALSGSRSRKPGRSAPTRPGAKKKPPRRKTATK